MKKSTHPISISWSAIDLRLSEIASDIWRKNLGVTYDSAISEVAPVRWYINTGRASTDFLRRFMSAKVFMLARILHRGGSDEEIVDRICNYIGYERNAW